MNEQDKLIADQLKTLPLELQQAILSVPWKNSAKEIGSANGLNPTQLESFEQETMLIIYGFENPNDYIDNLVREVGIDNANASTLADMVAEKILKPIFEKSGSGGQNLPEIAPEIHPMVEGQVKTRPSSEPVMILKKEDAKQVMSSGAQTNTSPTALKPNVSLPDYRYDGGKDPYREQLK